MASDLEEGRGEGSCRWRDALIKLASQCRLNIVDNSVKFLSTRISVLATCLFCFGFGFVLTPSFLKRKCDTCEKLVRKSSLFVGLGFGFFPPSRIDPIVP